MSIQPRPATDIPASDRKSLYPEPFARQVQGRSKRRLGEQFGLTNFGVNLTELAPGAVSALLHHHTLQDEFIYVVSGSPTLVIEDEEYSLKPGDCCGFKAGAAVGHQLVNRSTEPARYLEIGDRTAGDQVTYPRDDLKLTQREDGSWVITHKNNIPY